MTIDRFKKDTGLEALTVKEKAELIVYYNQEKDNFLTLEELMVEFAKFGLNTPKNSRLREYLSKSKTVVRHADRKRYRIDSRQISNLRSKYPIDSLSTEASPIDHSILPPEIYHGSRGYVVKLANQINVSYEVAAYDGCAVLMRRLLEVLLVTLYEKEKIRQEIESDQQGSLKNLSAIIQDTLSNKRFDLSKPSRDVIDNYRVIGNLSAHRIQYNYNRSEIDKIKGDYRVLIEELLYKSGLKK